MTVLRLGASPQKLDPDVVEKGVRLEAPMAPGVFWTILPWGTHSRPFKRAMLRRAQAKRSKGAAPDDMAGYMIELQEDPEFVASALVADCEGIMDGDGEPVPYTLDVGVQILSDPAWAHLLDWIVAQSLTSASGRAAEIEEAGNSSAPASAGKRGGGASSRKTKS